MSTFIGSTYIPNTPRKDENFSLLSQIMSMKQQKYDANRQRAQETLDAYGNLDLLREEDKDYVAARLTDITQQINERGNDFSLIDITQNITSNIKNVANDPYVQSALKNTQKFRSFQQQVAQVKEKNPELYSDINMNFAVANSGFKEYMNGESNDIGDLSYTPYTDYNKRINDTIIDLMGKKGSRTVEQKVLDANGNPTGEIREVEISGMSPDQLRSVAETMLTPQDMKQVEIDGWYNNGGYENPAILENITGVLGGKIDMLDAAILKNNIALKREGIGEDKKQQLTSSIDYLSSQKGSIQKNLDALSENPRAASTFMQKEKVVSGIVSKFAPLYTESVTYSKDDNFWAKMDYDLKLAKERRQAAKDAQENASVDVATNRGITQTSLGTGELEDIESYETTVTGRIGAVSETIEKTVKSYGRILKERADEGDEVALDMWNLYQSNLNSKVKGETDNDILRKTILENDSSSNPLLITADVDGVKVNLGAQIRKASSEFSILNSGYNKIQEKAKQRHTEETLDSDEYFKEIWDNKKTNMLWNGRSTPVYKVFQQLGIMDSNGAKIGDLMNNEKALKELKMSYYANDILNSPRKAKSSESLTELAKTFNEDPSTVLGVTSSYSPYGGSGSQKLNINPNTKTGQFLLEAQRQGISDRGFALEDNALVGDDTDIEKFITQSWKDNPLYKKELSGLTDKLSDRQQISISPNLEESKELHQQALSLAQNKDNSFTGDKNRDILIRKDGNEIVIEQFQKATAKMDSKIQQARVSLNEFRQNMPEFAKRVEFNSSSAIYTYDRMKDDKLISEPVRFTQDTSNELYSYKAKSLLAGRPNLVKYLDSSTAKTTLKAENYNLVQQNPLVGEFVDVLVDNSDKYSVNINLTSGYQNPDLHIKLVDARTGEPMHTYTLPNTQEADDFVDILNDAPEVYFSMLIDDVLKRQAQSSIRYGNDDPSFKKLMNSLQNQ